MRRENNEIITQIKSAKDLFQQYEISLLEIIGISFQICCSPKEGESRNSSCQTSSNSTQSYFWAENELKSSFIHTILFSTFIFYLQRSHQCFYQFLTNYSGNDIVYPSS
jgi:predicted PurR-regulated permease PerM